MFLFSDTSELFNRLQISSGERSSGERYLITRTGSHFLLVVKTYSIALWTKYTHGFPWYTER